MVSMTGSLRSLLMLEYVALNVASTLYSAALPAATIYHLANERM